ncbi:hypothetical protein [Sphingobium chungangianum]
MLMQTTTAQQDTAAYLAAVTCANRRAAHSYYDQHVIEDAELGYFTIDEGDYGALPMHLIDRIVHSVPGAISDEF